MNVMQFILHTFIFLFLPKSKESRFAPFRLSSIYSIKYMDARHVAKKHLKVEIKF
jgi:hypothetical protein